MRGLKLSTSMMALAVVASTVIGGGVAHAQALNITGGARMGIQGTNAGGSWVWRQENRLQFNFNVSVEADHGLTFGAWSRARITNGSTGRFSGSRVWVESNGFRLTFGNADGAFTNAGYVGGGGVGYEGGILNGDAAGIDGVAQEASSTGGGPASHVRVDYEFGESTVAVSHIRGGATEFGAQTSFDAFTVAVGYTNAGTGSWAVSGEYDGGSWGAGVIIARIGAATNWSLSANADLGGGNLYGYVGRVGGANAYGLSYGYDLGGGATITAGAERIGTVTGASVGVVFGF